MDRKKILGILLFVGGLAALVHGHWGTTQEARLAQFSPFAFSVTKDSVIPTGAAPGAVAAGAELLVVGRE